MLIWLEQERKQVVRNLSMAEERHKAFGDSLVGFFQVLNQQVKLL